MAGAGYNLAFGVSPILLVGGIAQDVAGGVVPLASISDAISGFSDPTSVGGDNNYFGSWQPLPGGTLIDQQVAMYPLFNQVVAANAVIQQPLSISMLMYCFVGTSGVTSSQKTAIMTGIQNSLDQHNKSGGTYSIITPSFVYTDCVMTTMTDASRGDSKQVQNQYKLDFIKPLVSKGDAQAAYNNMMSQIDGGGAPTFDSATPGAEATPTATTVAPPTPPGAAYSP